MARIITVADLREHVEAGVEESAIQRLIDDADQLVVDTYGVHGGETQTDDLEGGENYIFPTRIINAIATVTEFTSETNSKVLSPTDYRVTHAGKSMLRLNNGGTPALRWPYRVVVVYTVSNAQNPNRRRVVVDLVRLALAHDAVRSQRAGDFSSQSVDYQTERAKILNSLGGVGIV